MKKLILLLILPLSCVGYSSADTFVETIAQLSARDALVIKDDAIYASNYNNGQVFKVEQDGSFTSIISTSNRGSAGMRFDSAGNLYVAMYNINSIIKLDPQGNESVFASGVSEPIALDWDADENLYVSTFSGTNTVTRIAPDGTKTQLGGVSQLTNISSLVLDAAEDIYITSYGSGEIYKMASDGTVTLFASTGATGITFLQYDDNANVFYAANRTNGLLKINADASVETLISSDNPGVDDGPIEDASIQSAIGLALSEDGKNLYFATNTHIRRLVFADPAVDQVRPYFTNDRSVDAQEAVELAFQFTFIDPNNDTLTLTLENVPSWLSFDNIDMLTGTPAASDAGQTFTINALLNDGTATVNSSLSIAVSAAPSTPPAPAPTPDPMPDTGGSSGGSVGITILLILLVAFRRLSN